MKVFVEEAEAEVEQQSEASAEGTRQQPTQKSGESTIRGEWI